MMTTRNTNRVALIKSLRYGVELETVGIDAYSALAAIRSVVGGDIVGNTVRMTDGRMWKAVRDASLVPVAGRACEVVSPILTWGDMDNLQAIVRALRANGGKVNESCGMHVHVDGAAFKTEPKKIRNLIALAYRWEACAEKISNVISTRARYCRSLPVEVVNRFRAVRTADLGSMSVAWYGNSAMYRDHYDSSRYHWINVHALWDKGTIEFRLFNGTLHAGHVKTNVLFALGMAACALFSKTASFKGQAGGRTLENGRRAALARNDIRMFIVHVLCLVGDEFKSYRKHMYSFLSGEMPSRAPASAPVQPATDPRVTEMLDAFEAEVSAREAREAAIPLDVY